MPAEPLRITEIVYRILAESIEPTSMNIEKCANTLAMSATTFRRKLAQEETSFKLIQTKFLNELCVKELLTNTLKIDELSLKLGYSERATFERAFRQKFGLTPAQFRELSIGEHVKGNQGKLISLAKDLSPMPDSCCQLLSEKEQGSLDLERVIAIVSKDPVFTGRVIGQASKAIYGKTPRNLKEAVGRNLGINTVVNFAVLFGAKDALLSQVDVFIIERYCEAFLLAPKFFQACRKASKIKYNFDLAITEQTLIFGLIGILLLCHKGTSCVSATIHAMKGIDDIEILNRHVKKSTELSVFSASTLMLSLWHIDAGVIKQLSHLDQVTTKNSQGSEQDEFILFMLSCLFRHGAGHAITTDIFEKAELIGLQHFDEIYEGTFN